MIIDALLNLLTGLLHAVYSALPSWTFDSNTLYGYGASGTYTILPDTGQSSIPTGSPMKAMLTWVAKYNDFLPFDQLVVIATTVATFYLAIFGFKAAKYIIGVIRGAGTN